MSVSSTGARQEPQFVSSGNAPTFAADLTAVSDYSADYGNRVADTAANRTGFASPWLGLAWHETDTGYVYEYTAAGWRLTTQPFCVLGKSANQNLSTSSTAITWDLETSDAFAMHDGTNTSRITVPVAGVYEVTAAVVNTNTAGLGTITGRKQGTTELPGSFERFSASGSAFPLRSYFTVSLAAGEYIEIMALHSTATGAIEGGTGVTGAAVLMKRIGA